MNGKTKHVPLRSCVVCRQKYEKRRLTRFVSTETGVFQDPSGKRAGRGAYLCDTESCIQRASSTDVMARALKITLSDADRERIRATAL